VRGLRGGHSGINIHENRGNAIKLLTRILLAAADGGIDFDLVRIEGGSKHNAIPREAEATLSLPAAERPRLAGVIHCMREGFRTELAGIDDGLVVEQADADAPAEVLARSDRDRLLALLCALPHGVSGMSPALPGLVESSSNLAVVGPDDGRIRIVASCRSSVNPTLAALVTGVRSAGRLAGCEVRAHDGYPGWKPDMASPVLSVARRVFEGVWGRSPEVTAVHAGLECGLLGEKVRGLDMISFGPQIEGAHSPDERVEVASVERFWTALKGMLDALSRPAH
jgi:dipeptidase D